MRKIITATFAFLNILTVILLLATGYAGHLSPPEHPVLSLAGYAFPLFLSLNLAFVVLWIYFRPVWVLLPFAGFILACQPVTTYCPLNLPHDPPQGCIKVLSYNILGFNPTAAPEDTPNPILEYICRSGADIVCLQEYAPIAGEDSLKAVIDSLYPHRDTLLSRGYRLPAGDAVAIYSRYPIKHKEHISITTKGNTLGVFVLDIGGNDVHVINAHLETVGLTMEEKSHFSAMVHGQTQRQTMRRESENLMRKLSESTVMRAPQADAIAEYVSQHEGERIIMCGDLNDHPLSCVHHTLARRLTDCYTASGCLPGFSFSYHSMFVRIDNIMCSEHYKPYAATIDKSIHLSDHYPIYTFLLPENEGK